MWSRRNFYFVLWAHQLKCCTLCPKIISTTVLGSWRQELVLLLIGGEVFFRLFHKDKHNTIKRKLLYDSLPKPWLKPTSVLYTWESQSSAEERTTPQKSSLFFLTTKEISMEWRHNGLHLEKLVEKLWMHELMANSQPKFIRKNDLHLYSLWHVRLE